MTKRSFLEEKHAWIRQELRAVSRSPRPLFTRAPTDVRRLLEDIHRHLFDPRLSVGASRRRCQLDSNSIVQRFRRTTGKGIREYIEIERIRAACRLLRHPRLEVYLIAMAVGYRDFETFCRAFRRQTSHSATEYRSRLAGPG